MYKYKSIKQAHHSSPLPQKQNPFCIILYSGGIFWTSFQWTNLKPPTWRPGGPCAGRQGLRGGRRGAGMHAGEGARAVRGGRPVGGRAGPGCQEPPPHCTCKGNRGAVGGLGHRRSPKSLEVCTRNLRRGVGWAPRPGAPAAVLAPSRSHTVLQMTFRSKSYQLLP